MGLLSLPPINPSLTAPVVIDAVNNGLFQIHTVAHVEEALTLLTDLPKQQLFDAVRQRIHDNVEPRKSWWKRLFD